MRCDSRASLLTCTLTNFYFGCEPKVKVATKLNEYTKHVEPQYKEHMECDDMSKDMINQNGNYS
jgi:hypothetical protein